jgi:hypothetical protein
LSEERGGVSLREYLHAEIAAVEQLSQARFDAMQRAVDKALEACGCRKLRFEWSALADVEEPPRRQPHRLHRKLDGVFGSAQTRAGMTS